MQDVYHADAPKIIWKMDSDTIALTRDPYCLKTQVVPKLQGAVWAALLYCHCHAPKHPCRQLCTPTSGGESVGPSVRTHRRCKFPELGRILNALAEMSVHRSYTIQARPYSGQEELLTVRCRHLPGRGSADGVHGQRGSRPGEFLCTDTDVL